jgi:hypothetical protein
LLFQPKLHFFSTLASPHRDQPVTSEEEKPMCPVCITTAALIAGSVTSTGGLAAIAIKKFGGKNAVDDNPTQPDPNSFGKRTEQ